MSNWMVTYNSSDLMHYGIEGQKWGVRRYQNPDGSLTQAGIEHYGKRHVRFYNRITKKINKSEANDKKVLDARKKNRAKKADKFDRKIDKYTLKGKLEKANKFSEKKKQYLKSFDEATKYIKKGSNMYNTILKNYRDIKMSSFDDKTIKKGKEYKDIVADWSYQTFMDNYYNAGVNAGTKLQYASDYVRIKEKGKKPRMVTKSMGNKIREEK